VTYTLPPVVPAGRIAGMPQPVLKASGGLLLRPWAALDAPALYQASLDPEIQKWNKWRRNDEDEARATISGWREAWRQEAGAHWAVIRSGDRTLVGGMALISMRLVRGVAEVAYWTAPWARGAGVAPTALETLAEFAIDQVGFHRLELVHSTANQVSCRVALKCGFADEGVMRGVSPHDDGWHDAHLHARLAGDSGYW